VYHTSLVIATAVVRIPNNEFLVFSSSDEDTWCEIQVTVTPKCQPQAPKDPSLIPASENEQQAVQQLIDIERPQLMQHDSFVHPIPGTAHLGGTTPDSCVAAAKAAIHHELAGTLGIGRVGHGH